MKRIGLALIFVFAGWASCQKSDSDSVVLVNVNLAADLFGITQLQATITLGGLTTSEDFPKTNSGLALAIPTSFSLTLPRTRQGTVSVVITAVDGAGTPVGTGQDGKSIVVGGQTTLAIVLQPLGVTDRKDAGAAQDSMADTIRSDTGAGGSTTATGGKMATGGVFGTGGAIATGGVIASGGTTGNGGTTGTGGTTAKGGSGGSTTAITIGTGGTTGTGGTATKGGSSGFGSGGVTSTGGATTTSNGGTTGGSTPTGATVVFGAGKAQGAMVGYGWVVLGSADTITDPTCGATKTAITNAAPCTADPNWSATDKLCITGSAPALPAVPTSADYAANYGIAVGVNAGNPGVLGVVFTTITIAASGVPTSTVRAQVHVKGDPDGTSYCMAYSTSAMSLAKFATDCYNTAPTGLLAAASIPNIDKVSLEAVSGSTAVTVTSMCMTGITFGK